MTESTACKRKHNMLKKQYTEKTYRSISHYVNHPTNYSWHTDLTVGRSPDLQIYSMTAFPFPVAEAFQLLGIARICLQ